MSFLLIVFLYFSKCITYVLKELSQPFGCRCKDQTWFSKFYSIRLELYDLDLLVQFIETRQPGSNLTLHALFNFTDSSIYSLFLYGEDRHRSRKTVQAESCCHCRFQTEKKIGDSKICNPIYICRCPDTSLKRD